MTIPADLITEEWLKQAGFKWHQIERQPNKHWLLWLGDAMNDRIISYEDIGIELTPTGRDDEWFCWLRSDSAGRYHRFIHIRHIKTTMELVRMIEALTGQSWDPANNINGVMNTPKIAARLRRDHDRFDRQLRREMPKWSMVEEDDTRGRALPEHLEAHEKDKPLINQEGNT